MLVLGGLLLSSCKKVESTREVGHKGMARINPYLAAQRFLGDQGYEVQDALRWPDFDEKSPSMVVLPLSVLNAEGFVDDLAEWVQWGGHAVILLDHAESGVDDWDSLDGLGWGEEEEALPGEGWLQEIGLQVEDAVDESTDEVEVEGGKFEVWMESARRVGDGFIDSRELQYGRVTVVADARPFRNRWIGDYDHASLLRSLAELSPDDGPVIFLRFASVSFWTLLWERAWPAVIGLLVVVFLWLWKNLPRFGPLDSKESTNLLRAAGHHLEALGGFHWQLDRARALLHPLRESLMERAQRMAIASGQADADLFELLGERSGIGRERAQRAMLQEAPKDSASFTRLTADLQSIHRSLP
ncbi:MAG: DUF4350 domain-containing protein [Akkermansiaceae bacterium]|jgi:hypothetical protein|nr:DUF4350 domain-containing protein [Akkermansiaceae bacterium]